MLEKTMKTALTKKVNEWLGTIEDEDVRSTLENDLIITGGCFTSMILNEPVKDIDCYLRSKEAILKIAKYYIDLWNKDHPGQTNALGHESKVFVLDGANPDPEILKYYRIESIKDSASRMISNTPEDRVKIIFPSDGIVGDPSAASAKEELGVKYLPSPSEAIGEADETDADKMEEENGKNRKYHPVFLSTNAITLSTGVQVIVRFYGNPADIHDTYDFAHTKAYYDFGKKELVVPKEVYEATINKTLIYTGSKYPVCSVFRVRKFIERGWHINAGQLVKMAMQISELDLKDIDVLEEQLIGVDSLYFMNLIHQFRQKKMNDPEWELTVPYVISVIDKIF